MPRDKDAKRDDNADDDDGERLYADDDGDDADAADAADEAVNEKDE